MPAPLLEVDRIEAGYGAAGSGSQVLFGVSFTVAAGEFVTLVGRNGMGKTTTVRSIMGLLPLSAGQVRVAGEPISGRASWRVARAGLGLVPEGRQVFPNLTVRENLVATAGNRFGAAKPWTIERVHAMFPRLAERAGNLGSNLSGGEQQMLAIGRALMTNPRLLILDEATEGLAPIVRAEIWKALEALKAEGLAMIVIDKNIGPLMRLADHHVILEKGRVVWSGDSAALRAAPEVLHEAVGV
jgi:branched-chain amino acid transport system ATP-binding protein